MPRVVLAAGLARWLHSSGSMHTGEMTMDVDGSAIGDVLEQVFAQHPILRGYVVDDHGTVRHHVAIFVDGMAIPDKAQLQMPISEHAEIYILQALSGG